VSDAGGDLIAPAGNPHLQYQPFSSLVNCNQGERVLLRFANLGFRESAITLSGLRLRVVGKDATPMLGRPGSTGQRADTSYETAVVSLGAGESLDTILTAPAFSGGAGTSGQGYDTYLLQNRAFQRADHLAGGSGGQRTEVRIYPGGVAPQQFPNDWGV
jgi:hypothetical protein